MIDTQQWRASIGTFTQPSTCKSVFTEHSEPHELNDLCARLFITSVLLWGIYLEHTTINYMQPYVNTLLLSMDVESNPGPTLPADLQAVVDLINDNMNAKFDVMQHQIETMSAAIATVKQDVSLLQENMNTLKQKQMNSTCDIQNITKRLDMIEAESDRQQQYSRRENLLFHGITISGNEDYAIMRRRIVSILNEHVKVKTWHENDIVRAHRNNSSSPDKPGPVIARFTNFMDKLAILKARPELKQHGIGISNDLTKKQRQTISDIRNSSGGHKRGYYLKGKLVVVDADPSKNRTSTSMPDTTGDPRLNSSNSIPGTSRGHVGSLVQPTRFHTWTQHRERGHGQQYAPPTRLPQPINDKDNTQMQQGVHGQQYVPPPPPSQPISDKDTVIV